MRPEELKALQDKRALGKQLAAGVTRDVTWEVRERIDVAPWESRSPDGWRNSIVVKGEFAVVIVLPMSSNLRRDYEIRDDSEKLVVAGTPVTSAYPYEGAGGTETMLRSFCIADTLDAAIESATSWCRDCVAQGYVPKVSA